MGNIEMLAEVVEIEDYIQTKEYIRPTERGGDVLAGSPAWGKADERARQHKSDCFIGLFMLVVSVIISAICLLGGYFLGSAFLACLAGICGLMAHRSWNQLASVRIEEASWAAHTHGRRQMLRELQEQGLLR
jgi:hypothetical protein